MSFFCPALALAAMFAGGNASATVALFDVPFTDRIEVLQGFAPLRRIILAKKIKALHCGIQQSSVFYV